MSQAIFALSVLCLFGLGIVLLVETKSAWIRFITIFVLVLAIASMSAYVSISEHRLNEVTISQIDIEAAYKTENNDSTIYYVKEKGKDTLTCLDTTTIWKGDSNYVIRYEYPKLSNITDFLLLEEKTNYILVVDDLNIKDLPSLE